MFIEHPVQFKTGVRILMRILRTKDGGVGNVDRHAKKLISRGPEEFDRCMGELREDMVPGQRIYSTVDQRSVSKAIRKFKQNQLDNDYSADPHAFYLDIKNRFVSALQGPGARNTSLFLWDCDDLHQYGNLLSVLEDETLLGQTIIKHNYLTKNGGHIITTPFQYPKFISPMYQELLRKNAMMLWYY